MAHPITVLAVYDPVARRFSPRKIKWLNRYYTIKKICYYHMMRNGRTPIHIFHTTDGTLDFKLSFNGETLRWYLDELYDESA